MLAASLSSIECLANYALDSNEYSSVMFTKCFKSFAINLELKNRFIVLLLYSKAKQL